MLAATSMRTIFSFCAATFGATAAASRPARGTQLRQRQRRPAGRLPDHGAHAPGIWRCSRAAHSSSRGWRVSSAGASPSCLRGVRRGKPKSMAATCRISCRDPGYPRVRLDGHRHPADLQDRRVEITGPTDRKMVINALNSGAEVFMADLRGFADARPGTTSSTARSTCAMRSTRTHRRSRARTASSTSSNPQVATLIVRPRGWHLMEKHLLVDGKPIPGAFVDFGLYLFHNHAELARRGTRPVFLPAEDREPPRGAALGTTSSVTPRRSSVCPAVRSRRPC